nr:hypothetical protein BaRGS_034214 [Batillaria attramentaria]
MLYLQGEAEVRLGEAGVEEGGVAEVSLLLALMCKYSCEESELVLHDAMVARTVDVERGTILDNLARLLDSLPLVDNSDASSWDERKRREMLSGFPHWVLGEKLRDRVPIDNLIVLGFHLEPDQPTGRLILDFLRPYRRLVNPNMLYVSICAAGKNCKFNTEIKSEHENDIYISGFSDAILRWRTARVFISSTFRDMHGERDLLTRFVFPELRALGRHHFINVFEMDLRWGVTEEDTRNNRTLELCLQELTKCQLFVGLLGERYGWVAQPVSAARTRPEFDCVRQYKQGASVTELEMHFGALSDIPKTKGRAVFFIRDSLFEKDIPLGFKPDFVSESEEAKARLHSLKNRVRTSGHEVFDGYPCRWGGVVDNKPMVAGLEEFGQRALNMLWLAVQRLCPDENVVVMISAVEGDMCHKALVRLKADVVTVGALDMFEKAEVVRQTLAAHRKALDESAFNNQLKFLMMKKEAHSPLFLKIACEELRVFGVFEKVTSKLKSMSHTTPQLMQEVLQRLETDHGVDLVTTTLSLLICARDGLLSEELFELLAWQAALKAKKEKIQPREMSHAGCYHDLEDTLCSLLFIHAKCMLGQATQLMDDFVAKGASTKSMEKEQVKFLATPRVKEYQTFVSTNLHILSSNSTEDSLVCQELRRLRTAGLIEDDTGCMDWDNKPTSPDPCYLHLANLQQEVRFYRGHSDAITDVCFINQSVLCSASLDKTLSLWDVEQGHSPVNDVAFHPEGQLIVTGSWDALIRIYDIFHKTRKAVGNIRGHGGPINRLTFSPTGRDLITASDDHKVKVWSGELGIPLHVIGSEDDGPATAAALSPDGTTVAVGYHSSYVRVYDVGTGLLLWQAKPHTMSVRAITYTTDGNHIITGSDDCKAHSVCIWDVRVCEMDPNPSPESTMTHCHADWVNACGWSSTAEFMVTGSSDFNLKVWDMKTKEEKHRLVGHTSSINTMAYKFGCVVSGSSDGQVKVWSHRLEKDEESGADEEEKSWAQMAEEEEEEASDKKKVSSKKQKGLNVQDVLVVSCSDDGTVRLWRPLQANTLASLTGHSDRVLAVAVDKDGHVASAGLDNSLRLWAPKLVNTMQVTGQHEAEVTCITAGPDRNVVLSTDRWAHEKSVNAACFVNKGSTKFVTASDDMTMAVWDILHKKEGMIVSCEGRVSYGPKRSYDWPLSICPEGNQLLTTTTDGNVATLVLTKDNKSNHVDVSKHMKLTVPTDQVSNPAEVKEYPDPPNWVHVAAVGRGAELYFGDSWGQLSRVSKYVTWHQLKVHASHITGIVVEGGLIFTASADCTIKIWTEDFTQVGPFF